MHESLNLLHSENIQATSIHDCIMVKESDVEILLQKTTTVLEKLLLTNLKTVLPQINPTFAKNRNLRTKRFYLKKLINSSQILKLESFD